MLCLAAPVGARSLNGFVLDDAGIPVNEIVSGGPPRDGIPALNDPVMIPAQEADFLEPEDRVLGVEIGGEARAYPIAVLNWHEVVNDSIGRQSFVVSYCPLCGSGVVFASNAGEGRLVFGVSGLLYNSDVLLFDRNTESLWSQLMGMAVTGKLKGTRLPQLPVLHTTWEHWRSEHPRSLVMSRDTGFDRDYRRSPYLGYEKSRRLYFRVSNKAPKTLHPKALVLGVDLNAGVKAYPYENLQRQGLARFEDMIGERKVLVVWNEAAGSAYVTDPDGTILPATTAYWFAWYAFHPDTQLFEASGRQ